VITVTDLSVSYGAVQAVKNVSFAAEPGTITAVLGANGAGKTTLLRTISGLVRPTGGSVRLGDRELTTMSVEDITMSGIAHVPEGRGVIAEFTVDENLRLGALWRKGDNRPAIESMYELFPPLASRRKQHASNLSGGERQMLALARSLVARPTVLLLDEPSLGLAPLVTQGLMATVRDLTLRDELTVILVEQNARGALSIAKHAVVLYLGSVVVSDTAEAVSADKDLRHYYLGMAEQ
jgi:branched-chain amino acid transport system ATP-binding protein